MKTGSRQKKKEEKKQHYTLRSSNVLVRMAEGAGTIFNRQSTPEKLVTHSVTAAFALESAVAQPDT